MTDTLLSIDPGVTTGWSLWMTPEDSAWFRLDYGVIHGGLKGWLGFAESKLAGLRPTRTIFEVFRLGADPVFDKTLQASQIEGSLITIYRALGRPEPVWRRRSDKAAVKDRVLVRNNLWIANSEIDHVDARDVNDSQIHVLSYAMDQQHHPTTAAYWPDRVD